MARKPFRWPADGSGAILQQHSVAKLEVLREYLLAYFKTLATAPGQEEIRLTLVDGFAGGGVFRHAVTQERILGSPLVFLKASETAQTLLNVGRHKPLRFNITYIFVEKDGDAVKSLLATLKTEGYQSRLGEDIHVIQSPFEDQVDNIIQAIRKHTPRKCRALISLDQYGYKDVPAPLIRRLLEQLPRAEIVLTFAVDAFINFASDNLATRDTLNHLGIPDVLKGRSFEDIKANQSHFRLYIQSCLYHGLTDACGASYYTLFFIRTEGHGDYWLVHLSQHPKARDVMTQVHWAKNNHFIHYGGAGLDMFRVLGYDADSDERFTGQSSLAFGFDDPANEASVTLLTDQLVRLVHARETIRFGEMYSTTCNSTPADSQRYRKALENLVAHKEIIITSPKGGQRRKATTINDDDLIQMATQRTLWLP
jgi:three-Cys-motif partner protein